jgi:hypothetical protein
MPLLQGLTSSFKEELPKGVHDLLTDTIKIALYTGLADLGPTTTVYTATGEASGTGYVAGGITLTGAAITLDGRTACVTFSNAVFPTPNIVARGALIYNSSKANRSVAVLDFGSDKTGNGTNFTITFPVSTATTAVIRIA